MVAFCFSIYLHIITAIVMPDNYLTNILNFNRQKQRVRRVGEDWRTKVCKRLWAVAKAKYHIIGFDGEDQFHLSLRFNTLSSVSLV